MIGRTHDLAAITTLLTVVLLLPTLPTMTLGTAIIAVIANQLGGIAPDIDQPTAPFWRNLPIGGVVGRMITKMLGGHRFLTHSLIGLALLGFLVHLLLSFLQPIMPSINIDYVWWAFMIGAISHLIMDTFTKEGVPWFFPIPWRIGIPPFKFMRITTGGMIERGIIFPGLLILNGYIIYQNYSKFVHFFTKSIIK